MTTLIDWKALETWHVGDKIDAATWQRRWNDPMALLLRRPLTYVRRTTDYTLGGASGWGVKADFTFDTIVSDDDGMCPTGTPVSALYVQRPGVYDIYVSAPFISNNQSVNGVIGVGIAVSGVESDRYRRQASIAGATSTEQGKAALFTATLDDGDTIEITLRNTTGANATIKAQFNAPYIIAFWRGPEA